jgi:prepilin peptidase CpaA
MLGLANTAPAILLAGSSVVVVSLAAVRDLATRSVPNWLALAVLILGATSRFLDGTLLIATVAGTAVFSLSALCWRRGWMGGADVKLLSAAAVCVPPDHLFQMLVLIAFSGGLLALIYILASRVVPDHPIRRPTWLPARIARVECWRLRRHPTLPYVCAIAAGLTLTLAGAAP